MSVVPTIPAALATAIPSLLAALDEEMDDDFSGPAKLLMFEADDESVTFGIKELAAGQHPLDELMGFVAPDEWAAFGTICHGWATQELGRRPSRAADRIRVRSVHVVVRDGSEIGGFRLSGAQLILQDTVVGMVPDALRRGLGLATPAPEVPVAELSAADWLDAVADDPRSPTPKPYACWDDVRWEVIAGQRIVKGLSPTIATWMDEGMFARFMTATYPRTSDHLAAVRRVVEPRVYKTLQAGLRRWGLRV
ncbi:MAG TPA: hypothetical protein VFB78_13305 [Acidimicrobiales bacterium]|nr:hypothetical protein [Acidimicrobiales bacterium]